jgi:hypothetical protein
MNPSKVAVFLLVLPGVTLAQVCTKIEDAAERLVCYDEQNRVSAPAPAERQAPAPVEEALAPAPGAASETNIKAESPEEFGRKEPDYGPKEYIEATIVQVATRGEIDYLRLDNGQVWRELQNSHMRFREGRTVRITGGILNSYDLKMEGYNKIVKVKRVK